jgi:diaminohydroxyphosphoribosylaminopyrimidine deaminase/5-amino-6-(5-phosphoribosylamino)uracil reductase
MATEDPNPLVSGRGAAFLRAHGIEVEAGVLAGAAIALNRGFFTRMQRGRPFVTMKAALTLDGCVSFAPGVRTALTGTAANRFVHRERAEVDALGIGSGTLLTDNPLLTPRGAYRHRPLVRVVFDRRLRTPPDARLFSTLNCGPVIIVCGPWAGESQREQAARLLDRGATLEPIEESDDRLFLGAALARLAALGCGTLVVEGGPLVQRAFWSARLVDRVQLFITPHSAGAAGVRWDVMPIGATAQLEDRATTVLGDDTLIEGHVHRVD